MGVSWDTRAKKSHGSS